MAACPVVPHAVPPALVVAADTGPHGSAPVVVLPGGPLSHPRYLGNLGGLDARHELVVLELPHRRVDQIVPDVETLRERLGRPTVDVIAHSAGANLAVLYAAAYPDRIGKLVLITPSRRAVGGRPTPEEQAAVYAQHAHEPWYAAAVAEWETGGAAARALTYGRWDAAAQAHAAAQDDDVTPDAQAIYYAEGVPDPEATRSALRKVTAEVLVLIGGADPVSPPPLGSELAALFPSAEVVVQPGAGHYPWLDDPAWFIETVSGFLAKP